MQAMVRDDIIAIETFVALRFKYGQYAQMLNDAGGYCFIDQFIQHFGGENKGRYLAQQLEDNGVIKTKFFNNYKYCYLTDAAIKYITYKDDPRDFSKIKKANIPVKKIASTPTDKVLFSSALKFALMQKYLWIGKDPFVDTVTKVFNSFYAQLPNKDEMTTKAVNKTISYYDKSKILFSINKQKVLLEMLILDTGSRKSTNSYIVILKNYLEAIKIDIKTIKIVIISTCKNEATRIVKRLNEKIAERNAKEQILIKKYPIVETVQAQKLNCYMDEMSRQREEHGKSKEQSEIQANKTLLETELKKLNNEIPIFSAWMMDTGFYMEHYKDRVGGVTTYIKAKDQSRFDALKKSITQKI